MRLTVTLLFALALIALPTLGCGNGDGTNNNMTQPTAGPFAVPPNDALLAQLWHLLNNGGGGLVAGEDVRAQNAWNMMTGNPAELVTGRGVRLVVIDDGLHQTHEDLAANVLVGAGGTYNAMGALVNNDPTPMNPNDQHGTSVGGVAGAVGHNMIGVCGVAPRASLIGLVNNGGVMADVAAMVKDITLNHIYNMSYGPTEDGSYTLTDPTERAAIMTGLTMGRGGRGAIYLRAAGNGGEQADPGGGEMRWGHHTNLDGFNNEYGIIVVSSSSGAGTSPDYNQCGACITCCAPSGGVPGFSITTTDVMGSPIQDLAQWYTSQFGGTSSSCPKVAGVVALILQVNPNLTWRDIRRLLATTARQNDAGDGGWAMNGAGEMVHHKYGYGCVDAGAAVAAAAGFASLGAAVVAPMASATDNVNMMVADNMPAGGITRMMNVAGMPTNTDQIVLRLNMNTTNLRDHRVVLTSPGGTASVLLEPQPLKAAPLSGLVALNGEILLCSVRTMGEDPNGMWTLTITDEVAGRETMATFVSWALDVYAD